MASTGLVMHSATAGTEEEFFQIEIESTSTSFDYFDSGPVSGEIQAHSVMCQVTSCS